MAPPSYDGGGQERLLDGIATVLGQTPKAAATLALDWPSCNTGPARPGASIRLNSRGQAGILMDVHSVLLESW
ncbi:MAG: hypothetical protein FWC84_06250 [Alphaproteobacteria bacterium]|nr:hypothetical protein [Alphaproteobacteria bacterium]